MKTEQIILLFAVAVIALAAGFAIADSIRKRAIWASAQRAFDAPVISRRHVIAGGSQ